MPGIARKLVIFAAVDGLILQPTTQRHQRTVPSLQIRYTAKGTPTLRPVLDNGSAHSASLEAYGIVGLLNIASASYLVSISGRQPVAYIRGSPIYVITSVALIPLSSQSEANRAIERCQKEVQAETCAQTQDDVIDSASSADESSIHSKDHIADDSPKRSGALSPPYDTSRRKSQGESGSVAEDVIGRKGQYGRFAERWFSRKGWTYERRKAQGMSADDTGRPDTRSAKEDGPDPAYGDDPTFATRHVKSTNSPEEQVSQAMAESALQDKDVTTTLLPKLLRTTKMLFASRSFFYSYDYDITRKLGYQKPPNADVTLHRCVDPLYFWNQHLISPFMENNDHAYVLPIMQGFVGQRSFEIASNDSHQVISKPVEDIKDVVETQKQPEAASTFLLTLISRRSVKRPGLRYLRRGVDEDGHAANSVETEQILSRASWSPKDKIYSFTQIRGSIPLFFSQSPYAFKPVPVLQHSFSTNHEAFRRHFSNVASRYGAIQIALLVDKHGGEAEIGRHYEEHTKQLVAGGGTTGIKPGFEWFDFHTVCRGMRFENVSILIDTLESVLEDHGTTVEIEGEISRHQKGVLRINCMDCLDRTNVVQSACGSRALEKQLEEEGIDVDLHKDTATQWFNTLWADNGDAISKQYSSTAALKGDYTRTRKRNYRGALNDFGLTLFRYYNNITNDYFSQAAIDYLLGNVTEQVFQDFEADMMSKDPAISIRKVRANAIDVSSRFVIAEQSEDLIGGWTLLSPQIANTVRTFPFEEVILLLTDAAVYNVRFDWNLEKVSSFERVDLRSVTGIMRGAYITSTLTATQMDENKNIGFVIKCRPGKEDVKKVNTRSLSTSIDADPAKGDSSTIANLFDPSESLNFLSHSPTKPALKILAFKALPAQSSVSPQSPGDESETAITEKDLINTIVDEIRRAAYGGDEGSDTGFRGGFVEEREIIGLKEARKSTGYLEQWGHELKKLVWA